jgi:hypothetical protein
MGQISLARIGCYGLWPVRGEHQNFGEFWFGDAAERLTAYICTFRLAEDRPDRPLG